MARKQKVREYYIYMGNVIRINDFGENEYSVFDGEDWFKFYDLEDAKALVRRIYYNGYYYWLDKHGIR